jgi:hypothetical protein
MATNQQPRERARPKPNPLPLGPVWARITCTRVSLTWTLENLALCQLAVTSDELQVAHGLLLNRYHAHTGTTSTEATSAPSGLELRSARPGQTFCHPSLLDSANQTSAVFRCEHRLQEHKVCTSCGQILGLVAPAPPRHWRHTVRGECTDRAHPFPSTNYLNFDDFRRPLVGDQLGHGCQKRRPDKGCALDLVAHTYACPRSNLPQFN